jgi:hypothetical protein
VDWRMVWGIPAVGAAIIMIMFALTFRDTTKKDDVDEKRTSPRGTLWKGIPSDYLGSP